MVLRCLHCFASSAYSCFSRAALTSMAVLKVLMSIAIIVIVAVKMEHVRIELQLPVNSLEDLASLGGLANVTAGLIAGGGSAAASGGAASPPATPGLSPQPPAAPSGAIDLNTTAGPVHVDAACLLQRKGSVGQLDGNSRTMCSYVYSVCAISLFATLVMTTLLWCTCQLCGWGPILEVSFAVLGTVWWLVAALVLQKNTIINFDTAPAALELILGAARPPPPVPPPSVLLLPPPLPSPPSLPGSGGAPAGTDGDLASRLADLLHTWTPQNLRQWRQAVIVLSWVMMGMFAASAALLLVEACGCLLDVCGCLCRCCCPDRPESKWRARLRQRRKRMDGEEYVEMAGGMNSSSGGHGLALSPAGSASQGGAGAGAARPPGILVVARSDLEAMHGAAQPSGGSFDGPGYKPAGRRGWWG